MLQIPAGVHNISIGVSYIPAVVTLIPARMYGTTAGTTHHSN